MIETDLEWLTVLANRLRKRLPPGVDRDELLSDGYIALARLRHQYDAKRGVPFRGFAHRRVLGAMIDGLRARQSREKPIKRYDRQIERPLQTDLDVRLDRLSRLPRLVIQLHYQEGLSLRAVAEIFRCSQPRISQVHQTALRLLRAA